MTLRKKPFENNVGKGGNAGDQHFPPLPPCFPHSKRKKFSFLATFKLSFANPLKLHQSNILLLVRVN